MSSNGAHVSVSLFRLAGLAYLVIILAGVSAEALLRGPLIDYSDAAATAISLRENSAQFRLSIAADLAMALCDALLAILLFLVFRGISFSPPSGRSLLRHEHVSDMLANRFPITLELCLLSILTARFSGAAETQFEKDIRLVEAPDFSEVLARTEQAELSDATVVLDARPG